jgi:hypothetical protein
MRCCKRRDALPRVRDMQKHVPPKDRATLGEMHNLAKLGGSESVNRKARLSDQGNIFQQSARFDLVQGDRATKRFDWRKIDRAPIAFFCGGIGIGGANDFGNADDRFVCDAVIKENLIAHMHAAEIISRSEIAHAGPTGLALGNEIIPGIGRRFRFHEPIVFHLFPLSSRGKSRDLDEVTLKVSCRDTSTSLRSGQDDNQGLGG